MAHKQNELIICPLVGTEFEVDESGRVWRVAELLGQKTKKLWPCARRRAEKKDSGGYLQICFRVDGVRLYASAHRLVWLVNRGPIPDGLTINHKNGIQDDNRIENLELATQHEQMQHARDILGFDCRGEKHGSAKLTEKDIREIRRRRGAGEKLKTIAERFGVGDQCVSKIYRRERWGHVTDEPQR